MVVHPKMKIQPSFTYSLMSFPVWSHIISTTIGVLLMTSNESGGDLDDYCTVHSYLSNDETCNHRLMMLLGNET